jgi:hypothetical protein
VGDDAGSSTFHGLANPDPDVQFLTIGAAVTTRSVRHHYIADAAGSHEIPLQQDAASAQWASGKTL